MKQTFKTNSGSFQNMMMSNNSSLPTVNQFATIMHYTDRTVVIVREVSKDGKRVLVESVNTKADPNAEFTGMGHQNWVHEPNGYFYYIVWRNGSWKRESDVIDWTKEFKAIMGQDYCGQHLTKEQMEAVYGDHVMPSNVVEGITMAKKDYTRVNILFNASMYYYDWSF